MFVDACTLELMLILEGRWSGKGGLRFTVQSFVLIVFPCKIMIIF